MSELPDDVSDYLDLARVGSNNKKCPSLEVFLSVFSSADIRNVTFKLPVPPWTQAFSTSKPWQWQLINKRETL